MGEPYFRAPDLFVRLNVCLFVVNPKEKQDRWRSSNSKRVIRRLGILQLDFSYCLPKSWFVNMVVDDS
jgi:hypothetical protein